MKATTTAPQPQDQHPPLARDAQGNLLPVPDGTCAWRICRHTKGRPRIINGPDKQPARFPLDTTAEELADSCGADTYRVYALNEVGEVMDYVTTVETARELRNAAESDMTLLPVLRGPSTSSDLRYALEAVTHMARTNADAMRAIAESQAEWIKSISSARGFFRNAPELQLPAPIEAEEADDDDEPDPKKHWIEAITPIVGVVVQQLISSVIGGKAGDPSAKLELADLLDWRRIERKRDESVALTERSTAPDGPIDPVALKVALANKAMTVGQLLEAHERTRLMNLAPMLAKLADDPDVSKILAELVAMSPDEAATWIRAHLDMMEKRLLS
ncbi:MAG: hypothetical protein ACKV2T_38460 [Kofleriaceae bacterium]